MKKHNYRRDAIESIIMCLVVLGMCAAFGNIVMGWKNLLVIVFVALVNLTIAWRNAKHYVPTFYKQLSLFLSFLVLWRAQDDLIIRQVLPETSKVFSCIIAFITFTFNIVITILHYKDDEENDDVAGVVMAGLSLFVIVGMIIALLDPHLML